MTLARRWTSPRGTQPPRTHLSRSRPQIGLRPQVESLENVVLLSLPPASVQGEAPTLQVAILSRSGPGVIQGGITQQKVVKLKVTTAPGQQVSLAAGSGGLGKPAAHPSKSGKLTVSVALHPGVNQLSVSATPNGGTSAVSVPLSIVYWPKPFFRPFDGSPTPPNQQYTWLTPRPNPYLTSQVGRPNASDISQSLAEDPSHPAFSPDMTLGMAFFAQFVAHDVSEDATLGGQGPSVNPSSPLNMRTPALDLDVVYGLGPHAQPQFYTPDGLFFPLGPGGRDLARDPTGQAIIPDPRDDENGIVASIHLAFQKLHNTLMSQALDGADPNNLSPEQKDAVFAMVRNQVIGLYQGIVANQMSVAFTGRPLPKHEPPLSNIPAEFGEAVFRVGHTLVPNQIVVNHVGTVKSPTDPSLNGPGSEVPYDLLFGSRAQHAAGFDDRIADNMRTLLIPMSPTDPSQGDAVGGNSPNIGPGQVIDGVMHLDIVETDILRGRELLLPSGEQYLAQMQHRPFDPANGNTDLFVYTLREAAPLGHLGKVGTDIFDRSLGGVLAADPYGYLKSNRFSRQQSNAFRSTTFEDVLHMIGAPGF